jgi:hypothetical protein
MNERIARALEILHGEGISVHLVPGQIDVHVGKLEITSPDARVLHHRDIRILWNGIEMQSNVRSLSLQMSAAEIPHAIVDFVT